MTIESRCPIEVGRKIKRRGRLFKQEVTLVGSPTWMPENSHCYVPVQFRNGQHALLRWNMLDGNPMSNWDPVDEIVEVRSDRRWVNRGIWRSTTMPKIFSYEQGKLRLFVEEGEGVPYEITLSKGIGGQDPDTMYASWWND